MALEPLKVRVEADTRQLIERFAQSKRAVKGLEGEFKAATAAVADAARRLRATPGDQTLAKEFERLKRAAGGAKGAFEAKRLETEQLRRALAAQGVSVANLAADWRRLQAAQRMSQPISTTIPARTKGASAAASAVSKRDQEGLSRIEGTVDRLSAKIGLMGHLATAVFTVDQILPYLGALGRISDEYASFNAQLALATQRGGDLAAAQADVARIARAAASGIGETAVLYARLAPSVRALGLGQAEVAKVTETVALALRVSGASAAEAGSAILQLSQAFGSGVLRGEEFNSVNEAAPRLMQALADAIGQPRGELRGLAEQGRLSAEVLALALPKALEQLRAEAAGMPQTVGGAFVNLRNEFMLFVGRINEGVGVFRVFADVVTALASNLTTVLTGLTAAAAAYFARQLADIALVRLAEARAARAKLAETASQAAATGAAQQAELRGIAGLVAAYRGLAIASSSASATAVAANSRLMLMIGGVLRLLTGPVGLAVSIGLAAAAWIGFRREGTAALDAVMERQRAFLAQQGQPAAVRAAAADPRSAELDAAERQLEQRAQEIRKRLGRFRGPQRDPEFERMVADYNLAREGLAREREAVTREVAESARLDAERERLLAEALQKGTVDRPAAPPTATDPRGRADARQRELAREREAGQRLAAAQRDLIETLAEQSDRISADSTQREIELNRSAFEARTVSAERYYARLSELQQQQAAAEIAALNRRRQAAAASETRARAAGDEPGALAAAGEVARLTTDIALVEARLQDLRRAAQAGLSEAVAARARAEFETLAGQIDLQMAALARREQELFHQMDLGLPQLAAEGQVNQARRATAEATAALVAQMERLVALNPLLFDPATQERLAQFKSGMARLSEVADTGAQRINSALGTAMERLFMDLGSGAMSAADAFRGFLRTVVAEIQAVIARNLAQSLLRSLFGDGQGGGGAGGAGGLGGFISKLLGAKFGFAQGGYTGPGPKFQPAGVVHAGEYVFPATAVRRLGVGMLRGLHRFASGAHLPATPRLAYAEGGMVDLPRNIGALDARQQRMGGATVVMHISTPDAASFRRASGQIAADMAAAVDRGRRRL